MISRVLAVILALSASITFSAEETYAVKPRIIDGSNVPASQFPTVGEITDASESFFCTGTLIAPRFVLTAAHCAVSERTGTLALNQNEGRFKLGGVTYSTVHIYANPTYFGDKSQEVEGAIDLCIFELSKDVPGVTPSPLYRQVPQVGTKLTLVGYGDEGTGATGSNSHTPATGTVNYGYTPIDMVTETFIKWNFESVPSPNQESNTAPGDSGGPQFITVNNTLFVASVTSGGRKTNAGFGDLSYNTRVDIALNWIESMTGGNVVPGNNPPAITSFTPPASPIAAGQSVTFTAAASDPDGDALTYHWVFGDGSEDLNGSTSESHMFVVDGTYLVQLIVTDGKGGSAHMQASVQVGTGTPTNIIPALIMKKKFTLNFKAPERSMIDFTIYNSDFQFDDKFNYLDFYDEADINVYIGDTKIDSLTLFGTKAIGQGTLTFNYRQGTVRYQLRNNASLVSLLGAFGAANQNVTTVLTVPLSIEFHSVQRYGDNALINYTGHAGKTGQGK